MRRCLHALHGPWHPLQWLEQSMQDRAGVFLSLMPGDFSGLFNG